jgi:hypothetical protein
LRQIKIPPLSGGKIKGLVSMKYNSTHRPRVLVLTSTFPRWENDTEPAFVFELSRRLAASFD